MNGRALRSDLAGTIILTTAFVFFRNTYQKYFYSYPLANHIEIFNFTPVFWGGMSLPCALAFLLISLSVFFSFRGAISWRRIDESRFLKPLYTAVGVLAVWQYSFAPYNYYLDSYQLLDRVVLLILFILSLRSIPFVFPFLAQIFLVTAQLEAQLGGLSTTDRRIYFDIPVLVIAAAMTSKIGVKQETRIRFSIALLGVNYLLPALKKLSLGDSLLDWISFNELFMHAYYCFYRGWLNSAPQTQQIVVSVLKNGGGLLGILTLMIELLPFVLCLSRRSSAIIFVSFAALHLGIFLESGICFWKWAFFDLLLAVLLLKRTHDSAPIYGVKSTIYCVLVMSLLILGTNVTSLGWFDTRYFLQIRYEAELEGGERVELPKSDFGVFSHQFLGDQFFFLLDKQVGKSTLGSSSDLDWAKYLKNITAEELEQRIKMEGMNFYDERKKEHFSRFIIRYFSSRNRAVIENGEYFHAQLFPAHVYGKTIPTCSSCQVSKFFVIFSAYFYTDAEGVSRLWEEEAFSRKIPTY